MSTFSQRLTSLRESMNYSKTKLAHIIGVSLSTYANWEYGYNDPDMDTIVKLANVLNTSTDYLMGKTENPPLTEPNEQKNLSNKPTATDLTNPILAFDGRPIVGDQAQKIRDFAKFLLQEEDKHKNDNSK